MPITTYEQAVAAITQFTELQQSLHNLSVFGEWQELNISTCPAYTRPLLYGVGSIRVTWGCYTSGVIEWTFYLSINGINFSDSIRYPSAEEAKAAVDVLLSTVNDKLHWSCRYNIIAAGIH